MTTPKEPEAGARLKQARERAGFTTAKAAALAMGVPVATYTQHESGDFPGWRAAEYGVQFGVNPAWLMFGDAYQTAEDKAAKALLTALADVFAAAAERLRIAA